MYLIQYRHTFEDGRIATLTAGYTETPDWRRRGSDGQPEPCGEDLATAIQYKGKVYNLPGHDDFDAETGAAEPVDGGELLSGIPDMAQADDDRDEMLVDIEYRVTLLELGLEE